MGKPTGFMEYPRRKTPWRDPVERALDYYEKSKEILKNSQGENNIEIADI